MSQHPTNLMGIPPHQRIAFVLGVSYLEDFTGVRAGTPWFPFLR